MIEASFFLFLNSECEILDRFVMNYGEENRKSSYLSALNEEKKIIVEAFRGFRVFRH